MPLPAALLARLSKRGLVGETSNGGSDSTAPAEQRSGSEAVPGDPQIKHTKNKHKPAPPGWFHVPDASGRSYFWNVNTNQVSWLHPEDPTAVITMPASWEKSTNKENSGELMTADATVDNPQAEPKPKLTRNINVGKHPSLMKAKRERERATPYKGRKGRSTQEEADPMDPSSYSDVPKGSWSSGLVTSEDAKTGVDTTANGPLFQQRPYPSPGDIMRRNQAAKKS